jgi:hypothetical protein
VEHGYFSYNEGDNDKLRKMLENKEQLPMKQESMESPTWPAPKHNTRPPAVSTAIVNNSEPVEVQATEIKLSPQKAPEPEEPRR